jgi:hypothetical protein
MNPLSQGTADGLKRARNARHAGAVVGSNAVMLGGSLELSSLLRDLARRRPVFHSEADFQHAFAWTAHELDPALHVRLETHPEPQVRLDLLFSRPDLGMSSALELKYLTATWSHEVNGETFALKNQGAQDIRAYDVVKDIHRVERFVSDRPGWNGAVIVLTNEPSYWRKPAHGLQTNAAAFRLYEGSGLAGSRTWGHATCPGTMRGREAPLDLLGKYTCSWSDYSTLPGQRGVFRLLTFEISH